MKRGIDGRILWLVLISSFSLIYIPPASGDGTPIYYRLDSDDGEDIYSSTVESRQLASVKLLNDTHQRIDLFLSVYSLEPNRNMTIMVPFRTFPENVSSERTNDVDFLDRIGYDAVKELSEEQDMDIAKQRMERRLKKSITAGAVASDFGPFGLFGLYLAENYHLVESDHDGYEGPKSDGVGGGGGDYDKDVNEVKRYDFEGMSVKVFSVGVNATLDAFLEGIEIADPPAITEEVLEEYKGHYALTIDCVSAPPIGPDDYQMMMDLMPKTLLEVKNHTANERESQSSISRLSQYYAQMGFKEIVDSGMDVYDALDRYHYKVPEYLSDDDWISTYYDHYHYWRSDYWNPFDLYEHFMDLLNVIYGFSSVDGTVLSVVSGLNDGNIYFPLGTSKGWSRSISQTVIMIDVPSSFELNVTPIAHTSAFIEDRRCYLLEYIDSNPGQDVVATIQESDGKDEARADRAMMIHRTSTPIGIFAGIGLQFILFFLSLSITAKLFKLKMGISFTVLTVKNILLAISTLFISGPITYFLFVNDPFNDRDGPRKGWDVYFLALMIFYTLNLGVLVWAVIV